MTAKSSSQRPTKKGTLYLHGTPSHFGRAIAKALNLTSEQDLLEVDICIDGIRSIFYKKSVYRIDYTIAAPADKPPAKARERTSALTWLYSWFNSPDFISS